MLETSLILMKSAHIYAHIAHTVQYTMYSVPAILW